MICTSQLHTTALSPGLVLSYVNSVFYYYVMCMLLFSCGNNGVYCFFYLFQCVVTGFGCEICYFLIVFAGLKGLIVRIQFKKVG